MSSGPRPLAARRRFRAIGACTAAIFASAAAPDASKADDMWLNPAGGDWTVASNWSEGGDPQQKPLASSTTADRAVFALGSTTGYSVSNGNGASAVVVSNDNVTLIGGSIYAPYVYTVSPISVNSSAGMTSSLTLQGTTAVSDDTSYSVGGAGTSTLNLNGSTLIGDRAGFTFGGPVGSTFNYNQSGGTITSQNLGGAGITFGQGGYLNFNLSAGTINDAAGSLAFSSTAGVSGTLTSATVYIGGNYGDGGDLEIGVDGGSATLTTVATTISNMSNGRPETNIGTLSRGSTAAMNGYAGYIQGPGLGLKVLTGGGTGQLTAVNSPISTGDELDIGGSGGSGRLLASGTQSVIQAYELGVGYAGGTGYLSITGGASLVQLPGEPTYPLDELSYIGGNGGHGSVLISGIGSNWNCESGMISVGTDGVANGVGIVQVDHGGQLLIPGLIEGPNDTFPGVITLTSTGTLAILSGGRVNAATFTEVLGSTLDIGIDGPNTAANGQAEFSGVATFAGTLDVVFENDCRPSVGQSFQLFTFGSETGQFSALDFPSGYSFDTSQLYTTGTVTVTAVPEPAAAIGLAAAAVGMMRRRRRPTPESRN